MAEIMARYEFRVWAETLKDPGTQLQRLAAADRLEASEETYLISAATDRCNAKIRDDLLDVKLLIASDRGLEQWKPSLKIGFPLESSVISTQVFPKLELETPYLSKLHYQMDEFLDLFVSAQPSIPLVPVYKTRQRFTLSTCRAELSNVTINNVSQETMAVESDDPDAVLQLIRQLGIGDMANTSYIRQIKQLLGS